MSATGPFARGTGAETETETAAIARAATGTVNASVDRDASGLGRPQAATALGSVTDAWASERSGSRVVVVVVAVASGLSLVMAPCPAALVDVPQVWASVAPALAASPLALAHLSAGIVDRPA